jgi:hypothetical protein
MNQSQLYEQKYLKYKQKYIELKKNMLGGVKTLYYKRIGLSGINGDLRVGQVIYFTGFIYGYPINPDLPSNNVKIGSTNISYTITNLSHDDALVDIKLELSLSGLANNFIFEKKDVEIKDFKVIEGNKLSLYKLSILLDSVTNPNNKLEFKIDSTVRFGQHTGEFKIDL